MDYITKILGVPVVRTEWKQQASLPLFMNEKYTFEQADIGGVSCLVVRPVEELDTINAIKKHVARMYAVSGQQIVFELAAISRQRRKSFIDAKIAFVVPEKQLYLPFIGILLTERCDSESSVPTAEKLQPSAQMLLFSYILNGNKPMPMTPFAERFSFSAMTITRAANQLVELGLLNKSCSVGAQKMLCTELDTKKLYQKAFPYLIQPVRTTVFIEKSAVTHDMFPAGLSALSKMSMLNPPEIETWGMIGGKIEGQGQKLIDTEKQCALQLWRYDPRRISQTDEVDALSLAISLADDTDERIEQCIEEILEKVW